jgi:hypothetical protein
MREERIGVRDLRDLACVHDRHPVRPAGDHAQVVGDQDDGHPEAQPQVVNQLQDLLLDRDVQRRGGLVGDQQLRLARQCHGDHHALSHAAGELVRILLDPLAYARDADQIQDFGRAVHRLLFGYFPVQGDDLGDLLADRHRRVQRGQRVLKDHADLVAPDLAHVLFRERAQLLAFELDAAADDRAASRQQVHDRQSSHGLAAAGLAHNADRLTSLNLERDSVDGVYGTLAQPDLGAQVADIK